MTYQIERALSNESTLLPKYSPPTYPAPMQQIFTIVAGSKVSKYAQQNKDVLSNPIKEFATCKGDQKAPLPVATIYSDLFFC
jgi:hypothetical protein